MKLYAASVPRSVRTARLGHLRGDAIIGSWSTQNPNGSYQVFDVVMQAEAEFLRTKNYLASPPASMSVQTGQPTAPYVLRDIKQVEAEDHDSAVAYFRTEFKITQ